MAHSPERRAEAEPPRRAAGGSATLTAQHAELLSAVATRTADLLAEADQGRWPQRELEQLLDYLHLEVLRQMVDEEWLLFCDSHHHPQKLTQLRQGHLDIRLAVEGLADAAAGARPQSPTQLAAATRDLLTKLRTHVDAEDRILAAGTEPPSTSALGSTPHSWYEFTSGPLIDMDNLPGPHGVDAALGRILRLRGGEKVDLQASSDPRPIWRQLAMADPGGYTFRYLQHGPPHWRVQIERRTST